MPATKLTRKYLINPATLSRQMERLILIGMARTGVRTQSELARRMGLSQSGISKRMSGEVCWSYLELCKLIRELDLSAEEIYQVLSGGAA